MRKLSACVLISCTVLAVRAHAHGGTAAYGDFELRERSLRLRLFVRDGDWEPLLAGPLDANADGRLDNAELSPRAAELARVLEREVAVQADGMACTVQVEPPRVATRAGHVYLRSELRFACPQPPAALELVYGLFAGEHPGHRLIASIHTPLGEHSHVFVTAPGQPARHVVQLGGAAPAPAAWTRSLGTFCAHGLSHVLSGYDHLLFVFALLLTAAGLRDLLYTVSCFTLAHSLTLALGVLGWARPPSSWVEPVIALSIALVAAEALGLRTHDRPLRYLATFAFGLVHGFGFAGALAELQLSRHALSAALLGFNLGVELGQLAGVALVYPVLRWVARRSYGPRTTRALALATVLTGVLWFAWRVVA